MSQSENDPKFEEVLEYLHQDRGFDFRIYKRTTLVRRVRVRMQSVGIENFTAYLDYLQVHPDEFISLFNTILINVTSFFRDKPAWDYLASEILPRILEGKEAREPIRVWSAGCASGEEAYSLVILLAEALGIDAFRQRVKIYATDVDEEALSQARQANYSTTDLKPLSAELRDRYFELNSNRYTLRIDLRRSVIFGRHDLNQDAPISRLDLLVCRNTLMYFNVEAQTRVLNRMHYALNPTGYLFLGKAEMLLTHSNLFTPVELKHRIFSRLSLHSQSERLPIAVSERDRATNAQVNQNLRMAAAAFNAAPDASIAIDRSGKLMLANQVARSHFGLTASDLGRPFRDLDLSYQPLELRSLIEQLEKEQHIINRTDVAWILPDDHTRYLDVQLIPLRSDHGSPLGTGIRFTDVTHRHVVQRNLQRANEDLQTAYEELQSANEELETTNEELQSTVEELETTNEELQSTNEELETMNEELQSTNEEMQTLNDELQERTNELNDATAFLDSILGGLDDGIVVVDSQFRITEWNQRSEDLWGLRAEEVLGSSLLLLDIGLSVERLKEPVMEVIDSQADKQEIVLAARNRRGKEIECRVTCTPRLDLQKRRVGAIILLEELE